MSNTEIKFVDYELENQKGNLKHLLERWSDVPKVDVKPLKKSIGDAAEQANNNCALSEIINSDMLRLLSNTVMFFENSGVSFKESDEKCAKSIRKESLKYYDARNNRSNKRG